MISATADTSNGGDSFAYEVTDFHGNVVAKSGKKYCGEGNVFVSLSGLGSGYYEITAYNNLSDEKEQLAKTSFSVLEEHSFEPAANSYFGMNMHMYRGSTGDKNGWGYNLIKNANSIGAMTIRDGREWTDAENPKGTYNFKYAQFMDMITERNMDLIMVTGFTNENYDAGLPPYTSEGRQGFANYSKAAFDQYSGFLKYQEMFNEWWKYSDDGLNGVKGTYDEYLEIAKKVYETVDKEKYPDAVLFGEFGRDTEGWNKPLCEAGIINYMDAAAIHRYGVSYGAENPIHLPESESVTKEFKELRTLMDENGGADKPIWVTETGYNTSINKYGVTEYEQAVYLPRLLLSFISEGAEKVFWYDLLDDGYVQSTQGANHEYHFGLLRSKLNDMGAFSPKPAYVAYGVLTRAIDGKIFRSREIQDENIYRYIFSDGENETSALCAVSNTEVTLYSNETLKVTDIMGKTKEVNPENGKVTFVLTGEMIYIDGEFSF